MPEAAKEGLPLLDQGAVLILMRHMTQRQAEQSVDSLRGAYEDWNEVRVSQVQEVAAHLRTSSRKKGTELLRDLAPAAGALRDYLQDVFQQTHGLDLEFLRDDPAAGGKTIAQLSVLGLTGGSFLLWVAGGGKVPVHTGLVRLLDRLGLVGRTASMSKARSAIEPLVPPGKEREFTLVFHEIAERWSDPEEPIFMTVEALRECPFGRKAYQERIAQRKREDERRRRDDARRVAFEKKEAERRRREEERAEKRAEAERVRLARERERKKAADAKRREVERKKLEAVKQKEAARKKAEAKKKAAARKTTGAKKKADGKKKAGGSAKKAEGKRRTATVKNAVAKKTASKKRPASASAKRRTAKQAPASKKDAKQAKKGGSQRKTSKKTTRRR